MSGPSHTPPGGAMMGSGGVAIDFNRAVTLTTEVIAAVEQAFDYIPWNEVQIERGAKVRAALAEAVKVLIENCPACPDRTVAIRKLREARMDANSAITHNGRY